MYWDMNLDVFLSKTTTDSLLANWKFKGKSFPMKKKTSHDLVVDLSPPLQHFNYLLSNLSIFRLRRFLI